MLMLLGFISIFTPERLKFSIYLNKNFLVCLLFKSLNAEYKESFLRHCPPPSSVCRSCLCKLFAGTLCFRRDISGILMGSVSLFSAPTLFFSLHELMAGDASVIHLLVVAHATK